MHTAWASPSTSHQPDPFDAAPPHHCGSAAPPVHHDRRRLKGSRRKRLSNWDIPLVADVACTSTVGASGDSDAQWGWSCDSSAEGLCSSSVATDLDRAGGLERRVDALSRVCGPHQQAGGLRWSVDHLHQHNVEQDVGEHDRDLHHYHLHADDQEDELFPHERCQQADDVVLDDCVRNLHPHEHHDRRRATPYSTSTRLLLTLLLLVGLKAEGGAAVRCYCTDDHCIPAYGVCEASACLVGIRKPDLAVIRTCGEQPLGCQHQVGQWADLCACDQPFCNTFSYLRDATDAAGPPDASAEWAAAADEPRGGGVRAPAGRAHRNQLLMGGPDQQQQQQLLSSDADDDRVLFNRFDFPPGEYIDEDGLHHKAVISTRSSLLTLLLVIVPLSVGAATVMVVSFNYYCHLC